MQSQHPPVCSRRTFIISAGAFSVAAMGCSSLSTEASARDGLLTARPSAPTGGIEAGWHALRLGWDRDGFIYVPTAYAANRPAPLLVLLHGATRSSSEWAVEALYRAADTLGLILVVPDSRGATWDVVNGEFGRDLQFIDKALARAFDLCNVDPKRIGLGGFSDGASCALSLGVANGELFSTLVAFSPGFLAEPSRHGKPRVFITHGERDEVLPLARSVAIAGDLRAAGYDVTFTQFSGGHTVTLTLARQAFQLVATGALTAATSASDSIAT